ncbi:putative ribonuclease H-like domain-containing protein [Tanacetum coccineum]|uniref:Ribonuclease H-like domain-containing protein n=1 Tax=Tanacetum coccineum TaxID=301880 RepID=A0ABQ5J5G2_9ASTR
MNYIPVRKENYADSKEQGITCDDAEELDDQQFIVHTTQPIPPEESTAAKEVKLSSEDQALHDELEEKRRISIAKGKEHVDSTFNLSTANTPPQSTGNTPTDSDDDTPTGGVFSTNSFDAEEGGVADYNNLDPTIDVPSTPTLRIHKIHPQSQIIGKSTAGVQTRRKLQDSTSNQHQALLSFIYKQNRTNHKDQQTCLFACFLSQEEPKKVSQALADESWVEAMQEELLQFKLQEVWVLCDLPEGKRVIGTKWVFRNKRDERGTIIKNKARLVAQGYRQEEGVDYDEVFAPVARIEAIRLFLAFASFMGFIVYQMDVKSAFLYGNITEEVYVKQPPGFEDPAHPNKVYRVVKALYGLHQAPRAWYERLSTFLLKHGYRRGAIDKTLFIKKDRRDIMLVQVYVDDIIFGSTKSSMVKDFEDLMQKEFKMSSMGELTFFLGLQVKQSNGGIFLSQDKYVKDILNKFDFRTIKPASTPIEAHKSLGKDEEGEDVDVHLYRSMIGCLMYLTASRPDIMFAVCLCARFQVTPKVSHLHAVKRIFRYLKHQPKLGLWYPKDSPFHLEAFSDSDYAGDNHDRRSTSGGCQYLGRRLVSWQCKKQTIVAISSTEAEYVAAASCCAQVLWMQNQLLDYGFNFMNTEIHIDNESTICIVKNPVFHSKTKHIQIRHHFIRDCYEQRLINVVKVHTDDNVADLLTKGFDLARFNFLVYNGSSIDHTAFVYEAFDATDAVTPDLERKSDETEERKSDETEEVIIEEEKDTSDVKSGDTEELDLERIQSTARQSTVTPRTLNFDDEAELGRCNDEEIARKVQEEWNAEEERKRLEDLKKPKPKTISKKPTSLAQERTQMMSFLKGQGYKNLQKLRKRKADVTGERCKETLKEEKSYSYRRNHPQRNALIEDRDN